MMLEVKAIIRTERLRAVVSALHELPNMPGVTVSTVTGFGRRASDASGQYADAEFTKVEAVIEEKAAQTVIDTICRHARTGGAGDGKIFVSPVLQAIQIRDGANLDGTASKEEA